MCSSDLVGGTEQIFVMNADGTGVVQVTSASVGAEYPSWSPDGAYLAFDSDFHIWVVKPDGSDAREITGGTVEDHFPRWRP